MGKWEPMFITTDRGKFECFRSGNGKPLCTTHLYQEFTSEGNIFADILADYYQVYIVNLKAAGKSSMPKRKSELTMRESIKDLESIREILGYQRWSYAGHSTGGFLGLEYVTNCSENIETLILSGTAPSNEFQKSKNCIYNFRDGVHRKEMGQIWLSMTIPFISAKKKAWASRRLIELSLFKPEKLDEYFSDKPHSGFGIVWKRMRAYLRDLKTYDVRNNLSHIDIPTLVLCGEYDVQCPVENSYEIVSLLQNPQLVIFNESNHFPFIEQPVDFEKAIAEFANRV